MLRTKLLTLGAASVMAIAGFSLVATPAWGGPKPVVVTAPAADPDEVTRIVSYSDLNLASEKGEKMLNGRVRVAAKSICLEVLGPTPYFQFELECRGDAWRSAKPQIALAVQRARELALTGQSSIAAAAITINMK